MVLLLATSMLAALLRQRRIRQTSAHRLVPGRLPATLDNYSLRFRVEEAGARRDDLQHPARRVA